MYKYSFNTELNLKYDLYQKNAENSYNFPSLINISEKLLIKAKTNYEIFNNKYTEYFSNKKNELNDDIIKIKSKYDFYMNDYRNIFLSLFPKNGFFILCHNDCHRWNFLYKDLNTKLLIIDHLGLPGLDLCNYFNENSFYFYENGNYEFKKEEINFEFYFEEYRKYCELFIELNKNWINNEENKEFKDLIKTKDYYLNLHCVTNVFWFLFCVINLNFENEFIKKCDHYFQYGYDRLLYSELAKKKRLN